MPHARGNFESTGVKADEVDRLVYSPGQSTEPDYWIFGGGAAFVALTLAIGISDIPLAQEIVFCGSMAIIAVLIYQLVQKLPRAKARALIGTALIIFVFRAVPLPGAGATWFMIDQLRFDQQFLSVLSLISSCLTLLGMVLLRPLMASRSIAYIVVLLTLASGVLALPNIGLYYGIQNWTARLTGGVVDAHFIAIIETTLEVSTGPGRDDSAADLDRAQCTGRPQGDVLRGDGLVHQHGADGQQLADEIYEPDLPGDPRG